MNERETRVNWLHVRLTPSEAAVLRERARREGKRISDLARALMLAGAPGQDMNEEHVVCHWAQEGDNEDDKWWRTSCGEGFFLLEGTPAENGMHFCSHCGKPLAQEEVTA
ncbi:MAG: hypothetical protein V1755_13810 [Chloroflexota bacterium]